MRVLLLLLATSFLATACSTRAMRPRDDLWSAPAKPDAAAFIGYHGPAEPERPVLR